jgi:hypothetical protein
MSADSSSGVTRFFANTTNFLSGPFVNTVKTLGYTMAPACLGAIGGRITGCGWRMGLVQGATGSLLHQLCIKPLGSVIGNNTGNQPGQFNDRSVFMLSTVGFVLQIAVPILVTKRYGGKLLTGAGAYAPFLLPGDTTQYTWRRGLVNNIAPAVAEFTISTLRGIDSK